MADRLFFGPTCKRRPFLIKRETFLSESCEEEAVRRRKEINWLLLTLWYSLVRVSLQSGIDL